MSLVTRTVSGVLKDADGTLLTSKVITFSPAGVFGDGGVSVPPVKVTATTHATTAAFSIDLLTSDATNAYVRYQVKFHDGSVKRFDLAAGSATTLDALINLFDGTSGASNTQLLDDLDSRVTVLESSPGSGGGPFLTITSGITATMDADASKNFKVVPAQNITLSFTGGTEGDEINLWVQTSGTTARTITFSTNFVEAIDFGTGTTSGRSFLIKFVVVNDGGTLKALEFGRSTMLVEALTMGTDLLPTISTASLADGIAGVAYSQTVTVAGGDLPITLSVPVGALPTGVTMDTSTGALTGTPTAGSYSFTIRATDADGDYDEQAYSVTVAADSAPTITTATLPDGMQGVAYSQTVSATSGNAPVTFAVQAGSLPAGLSLNASTGAITGTPTTIASYGFTIRATDANGDYDDQVYTVGVVAGDLMPTITTATLPSGTSGVSYSQTVAVTSGDPPITFSAFSGALPTGLSLNTSTGAITGTPSAAGTFNFTIRATDTDGDYDDQAYTVTMAAAAFAPSDISGLQMWLKKGTGLYQDSGKATPATAGSVVGAWANQGTGGTGLDVKQTTAGNKPVELSGAVHFDGVDDFLVATSTFSGKPATFFGVVSFDTVAATMTVLGGGTKAFSLQLSAYLVFKSQAWANIANGLSVAATSTFYRVIITYSGTGAYQLYINGVSQATGTDSQPMDAIAPMIGDGGNSQPFDGIIKELGLYDSVITGPQITSLDAYLATL